MQLTQKQLCGFTYTQILFNLSQFTWPMQFKPAVFKGHSTVSVIPSATRVDLYDNEIYATGMKNFIRCHIYWTKLHHLRLLLSSDNLSISVWFHNYKKITFNAWLIGIYDIFNYFVIHLTIEEEKLWLRLLKVKYNYLVKESCSSDGINLWKLTFNGEKESIAQSRPHMYCELVYYENRNKEIEWSKRVASFSRLFK